MSDHTTDDAKHGPVIVVSGAPGVGKTTVSHLVAAACTA
jgi:adenylate kinase